MNTWIVPCNLKCYDVFGAFTNLDKLDWKQSLKSVAIGDVVSIYVGNPVKAIMFKCPVTKVNIPCIEIDDSSFVRSGEPFVGYGNHMEIERLGSYHKTQISLTKMREYGMKGNMQGPCRMPEELQAYVDGIEAY